ncbi:hypothetical protein LEP1GSC085_2361 [Leptospira interrogans str. L0996]|nr:hypothetical protein LEP1GSC085_2361 [Leptospira interrogans str. L0996]
MSVATINLDRTSLQRFVDVNINRFMGTIKYNLHTANFRLGYSMDLRSVPGGRTDGLVSFYDQSVFFSISSSELTRVRLFRFRKRPFQAGDSTGISSENP